MEYIRNRSHSLISGLVMASMLIHGNDIPRLQEAKDFLGLDMLRSGFASGDACIRVKEKVPAGIGIRIQFSEVLLAPPRAPLFRVLGDLLRILNPKNFGVFFPALFGPRRVRPSHGLDNKTLDAFAPLQLAKNFAFPFIELVSDEFALHFRLLSDA